jgi:antitoxin MazE
MGMQTALRKVGNSTAVILPRAILGQAGLATGSLMQISVEGERIVLTPVRKHPREGWEEAAAIVAATPDPEADDWLSMPLEADEDWVW